MHELGIVFHVIRTVERVGAENDLTRVAGVTLELGEVCGAIPKELTSCWDWAVQRSDLLRGARLHIDTLSAVTKCGGCGAEYPPVAVHNCFFTVHAVNADVFVLYFLFIHEECFNKKCGQVYSFPDKLHFP